MTGNGRTRSLSLNARQSVFGVLGKPFSDEQVLELVERAAAATNASH
jgi:hypothetical protein